MPYPVTVNGVQPATQYIPYKFSYYSTTAQNSGNAAFAQTLFQVKEYDTGSNVASSTFTTPIAGFYNFNAGVESSAGTTVWIVSLFKNGSEWKRGTDIRVSSNSAGGTVGADMQLAAGDTVDVRTFGNAAVAISVTQASCYFMGRLTSLT